MMRGRPRIDVYVPVGDPKDEPPPGVKLRLIEVGGKPWPRKKPRRKAVGQGQRHAFDLKALRARLGGPLPCPSYHSLDHAAHCCSVQHKPCCTVQRRADNSEVIPIRGGLKPCPLSRC
jgi:hypothetical protein